MRPHPLSEIFPPLEGAEFDSLVEDIRVHGLAQPIVMYQGKILDGRNRARACERIGIKPKTTDYRGTDPLGYVLSLNLSRRHLTESQRAMVAAKVAEIGHGGDRRSAHQAANLPLETQAHAAKAVGVSERSVRDARKVVERGTSALKKSVERGEIPVSTAAKLADAPAHTQKAAVEGGKAAAREIVDKLEEQKANAANDNRGTRAEDPSAPPVRTLGLDAPAEMLVRIEKEQNLIDKMSKLLAELKRTFTEYEGIKSVVGKLGKGRHYGSALRDALEQLNLLRKQRPASLCPHCKLLPELMPTCNVCRNSGYIGEEALGTIEKCLLAEGDDAGVWVSGKWRTLASMRGDDF